MTVAINILLVDDHALIRDALSERLFREPGFVVIGCASNAEKAIQFAEDGPIDIILMDINMPGLNCFDAARRLSECQPLAKIIFLSAYMHDRYIEQALEVRAHGYLTKGESPEKLVTAIRDVASGGAYFSPEVQSRIVVNETGVMLKHESISRISTLSKRELEVLNYIARGLGKKEIARISHISVKTVDHHTSRLMKKLAIHDRVELARFAIREGLAET